jgi:mRNA deadenylase 3'-5' endonuclease subunit Ccr4
MAFNYLMLLLATTFVFFQAGDAFSVVVNSPKESSSLSSRRRRTTLELKASIQQEPPSTSTSTTTTNNIIAPNHPFRDTNPGEVSIVSYNMLAPFYAGLNISDWKERQEFMDQDRADRVPMAIDMACQANADILCLQEVEGLEHEPKLRELMAAADYDSLVWTPLMPKRTGDVVGLCIAWKSRKHKV